MRDREGKFAEESPWGNWMILVYGAAIFVAVYFAILLAQETIYLIEEWRVARSYRSHATLEQSWGEGEVRP